MEDNIIIELYFSRDERAIQETSEKYGSYLLKIANNILNQNESSEECVNDTYLRTWNTIPPTKPGKLSAFLARITRNLAIDHFRKATSDKHGGGQLHLCLDELYECIGEKSDVDDRIALRSALESFLRGIPVKNKDIFLLRYFYLMPLEEIADRYGMSDSAVKMVLYRLREKLRGHLEKEGIIL